MLFDIPNELIPYVRVSKKYGLVCSDDIPDELMPLYEKAKTDYEESIKSRLEELQSLMVSEDQSKQSN